MTRLALAYLLRRPVQILAVLGVAVGLLALLVVLSVMNGLIELDRASARGPLSDLVLIPPVTEEPPDWETYRDALATVAELESSAPHLVSYAVLGLAGGQRLLSRTRASDVNGIQLVGVDLETEYTAGGFREAVRRAKVHPVEDPEAPFRSEGGPFARPGILVSDNLARSLNLRRGETLEFACLPPVLPPSGEELLPHNGRFTVVGSYASLDYGLDMDRIYLQRTGMQGLRYNLLGDRAPPFTEVLLELREGVSFDDGKAAVLAALSEAGLTLPGGSQGGVLETWEERRRVYLTAIENERRVTTLVMFFVVVVAAFGLFATLSALVRQKVKDLGILAALGSTPLRLGSFLLLLGALASAAGCALGHGGAWLLVRNRAGVEAFLRDRLGIEVFRADLYVVDGLPAVWLSDQAWWLTFLAFLTGVLFTLAPSIRAASLVPSEALRYE